VDKFEVVLNKNSLILLLSIASIAAVGWLWLSDERTAHLEVHEMPKIKRIDYDAAHFDPAEEEFLCKFENRITILKDKYRVPGTAIAIVKDGNIIFKRGFGYRNIKTLEPVTTSTVFRVGSVSKGFAAVLAGLLEQDDFIEWEKPVSIYIPDYRVNPAQFKDSITISHILSHTAGYPYQAYSTLIEDGVPLDDMIESLQDLQLSRQPGEIHAYQNVAYSIIEKVLQEQTMCSFKTLMHQRVFSPLNMYNASIDYKSISEHNNVAYPHYYSRIGTHVGKISSTYYNASAAGGVNASIDDMAKWLIAIMGYNQDVLPDEVRQELFKPAIVTAVKNSYLSRLEQPRYGHYGLGWRIVEYPSDTLVYHEGYVNGYKSAIGFSKTDNIGICILTNSGGAFSSKLLAEFLDTYRPR